MHSPSDSKFRNFSASEEEVIISRMLDKIIRRSDTIDKESLCILAGQRVSLHQTHSFPSQFALDAGLAYPSDFALLIRFGKHA
jgi:hypothetical protein